MTLRFVTILLAITLTAACVQSGSHTPSAGAKDVAGAAGTIEYKPSDWVGDQTTWWKDTDGVDPGVAGCHIGADESGAANRRMFGEACLASGLLVESNPGADQLHSHDGDLGHPDTFDCNAWCIDKGANAGSCIAAPAPPCEASARCACE